MNVYDWDKTIYPKDSTVQFYFYCLKRNPKIISCLPHQIVGWVKYFFKKIDKTQMKNYFYVFLSKMNSIDDLVNTFWQQEISNVNKWYLDTHKDDDIVISASPYFLIKPACDKLNIKTLIASEVDKNSGEVLSKNCSSEEKVNRFTSCGYDTSDIDCFYSDSYNDRFLARLAKKAYLVKKGKVVDWDKY